MWLSAVIGLAVGSILHMCADRLPREAKTRRTGTYRARRWAVFVIVSICLFIYVWRRYGWNLGSVTLVTYCSLLLLIAVIDLEHRLVPNVLVGSGMVMALGFSLISAHLGLATTLWGALMGGGTFMLLSLARRGALGAGDVKLAALIGMMTGYPGVLLALTLGIILGGLAAGLFLLTGVKRRDQYMPYAPYLTAGSAATLLWSQQIASWYVGLIGLGG